MVADLASRLEATIRARLDTARIAGRSGSETWWLDTATPYGPKLVTGPGDDDHWDRKVESAIWTCTDEEDGCPEMARSVIAEGRHIAANDPAFTIRDCERDLRVLDRHRRKYGNESWCRGCRDGWPCREIADLIYAYGLDVTGPGLVTWLRQQLDADEAVARHAFSEHNDATPEWEEITSGCLSTGGQDLDDLVPIGDSAISRHMERWDPARVLAEVAAKRRILDLHVTLVRPPFDPMTGESQGPQVDVYCEVCGWVADDPPCACDTVRLLALPFADRAGYRPEWHPDREGDDDADHR